MYWDDVLSMADGNTSLDAPLDSVGKDDKFVIDLEQGNNVDVLSFDLTYYKDTSPEALKKNHYSNRVASSGVLTDFYYCCGIIIGANWSWDKRIIDIALELATRMGYTSIIYAVAEGQEKLRDLLLVAGFVHNPATEFRNIRSDNKVAIYSKVLEQ